MSNKKLHDQILKYIEDEKEAPKPSDSLKTTLEKARNNVINKGLFITESNIEAYVRGDLDLEKCAIIENRMATDPEFAAKVAMEQAIVEGIRQYAAEQESLQRAEGKQAGQQEPLTTETGGMSVAASNAQQTNPPALRISYTKWLVAATLALLLAAVWFIRPIDKTEIFSDLVEQERKSAKGLVSGSNYAGTEFDSLKILYDTEKYIDARNYYNRIPINKRGNECTYLIGMTWFVENNYSGALPYFESIMDDDNTFSDFRAKSYFTAALCYWGLNNKYKTKQILDSLETFLMKEETRILNTFEDRGNKSIKDIPIYNYIQDYRTKSIELKEQI